MRHLSNDEIIESAEGRMSGASHLAACGSCRARVDDLRRVLQVASQVSVPEPSPLFWDHLSERIRAGVAEEPALQRSGFRFNLAWGATVAGALAIVVIGVAVTLRSAQPVNHLAPLSGERATIDAAAPLVPALNDDPAWAVMGELAAQIDWEDATEAGLTPRPGSAEQALSEMSEEEQRQVVELLQIELQKAKSL